MQIILVLWLIEIPKTDYDFNFNHNNSNTTNIWFQNGFLFEIVFHTPPLDFETKTPQREKSSNTEFFSGPYFPIFKLSTVKYGPEKTLYPDTFHAVWLYHIFHKFLTSTNHFFVKFTKIVCAVILITF